jgi:hypothetical protein
MALYGNVEKRAKPLKSGVQGTDFELSFEGFADY